jgi:hypothetical protein
VLGNTIDKEVSPYFISRRSRSASGRSVANSRKNLLPSTIGTLSVDETDGVPRLAEMTRPISRVKLSKKPYSLETEPSLETNTARMGTDLILSSLMHRKNSVDEIAFLVMAKEMGVETAVFWARNSD